MQSVIGYARSKKGFGNGGNASPYVVTNPGIPPQSTAYLNVNPVPDLALIYENSYQAWNGAIDNNRQAIWNLDADNNQLAVMLHDVPDSLTCAQTTALVNDLKGNVGVGSLWLTDLKGDASYLGWPNNLQFGRYISSFENNGAAC